MKLNRASTSLDGASTQRVAGEPLFCVENLRVFFGRKHAQRTVVKGVSLEVRPGRCIAIVGESGSGKSVTARALVGLTGEHFQVQAHRMSFGGQDVSNLTDRAWKRLRGKHIGFVLQDALVSLDPLRPVGREIAEAIRVHGEGGSRREVTERVIELLKLVGVPEPEVKAKQLPHALSGGQRQRALIASAIALDPALLIADEPTTALDATIQAQVLDLLAETRARGKAMILISHDLSVVSQMADEVLVMRHGEVVERGTAEQIFRAPKHAYTQRLLDAIPSIHSRGKRLSPSSTPRLPAIRLGRSGSDSLPAQPRSSSTNCMNSVLLEAKGLVKRFRGPDGNVRTVVNDVSFTLAKGETLGIVGESGSGKTTVARMALALESPDEGEVTLDGKPWTSVTEKVRRLHRSAISVVYQDPLSSFDPRWTIEQIFEDALKEDNGDTLLNGGRRSEGVSELLDLVGLSPIHRNRRPLELSGGQRQRVAIARAIAPRPKIIVCDEPVSALDVSIQAQILDLLGELKVHLGMSYLFISHDLGVVHHLSDRVMVMSQGQTVEAGAVDDIFLRPQESYTRRLVAAVPRLRFRAA